MNRTALLVAAALALPSMARGEAELRFQQAAELLPIPGITSVGLLPPSVQQVTVYAAGLSAHAAHSAAGHALIQYMASAAVKPTLLKEGLQPP